MEVGVETKKISHKKEQHINEKQWTGRTRQRGTITQENRDKSNIQYTKKHKKNKNKTITKDQITNKKTPNTNYTKKKTNGR